MALLNVLINARDAMPGGGTVTVGTSTTRLEGEGLNAGAYVVLSVQDEGVGMPPHVVERATEPGGEGHRAWAGDGARVRGAVARTA
jgi:signal transduction histidine kinase